MSAPSLKFSLSLLVAALTSTCGYAQSTSEAQGRAVTATAQVTAATSETLSGIPRTAQAISDLAAAKQFDKAVALGESITHETPENARAHLALAYAYRNAGQKSAALKEYQDVTQLEPNNQDALIGQGRMYQAVGAPMLATDLIDSGRVVVPKGVVSEVRHAHAVQLVRLASTEPEADPIRKSNLAKAVSMLRDLVKEDESKVPDLIAALSRAGSHQEAVDLFVQLQNKKAAPVWIYPDAANSYLALKNYGRSIELYTEANAANPKEPEIWEPMFYVLSDGAEMDKAQALMDRTVADCLAAKCEQLDTAQSLQIYSRLWADDVLGAKKLALEALERNPGSIELKGTYISVLSANGLTGNARDQIRAAVAQNPDHLDFLLSKLVVDDKHSNAVIYEADLAALEKAYPGNEQVARIRKEWNMSRAASSSASFLTEQDDNSVSTAIGLSVTSAALNAQGLRLIASTLTTNYCLSDVNESGTTVANAFGVDIPFSFATDLKAQVTTFNGEFGVKLAGQHQWSDAIGLTAGYSTNDADAPTKGLASGVRMSVLNAGASYRLDATNEFELDEKISNLSDGNMMTNTSLAWVHAGVVNPNWTYKIRSFLEADTASLDNAVYFSPRSSQSIGGELTLSRRYWLTGGTFVTITPKLDLGVTAQSGYSAMPFVLLGSGATFKMGENATLELNASLSQKPYDGSYSVQTIFGLVFTWVWY